MKCISSFFLTFSLVSSNCSAFSRMLTATCVSFCEFALTTGSPGGASLLVTLRQDIFRPLYLLLAMLVLMVPYTILGAISSSFEKKRWENSTVDDKDKPSTGLGIAFIGVRAIWFVLWGLIQILASFSSNSDD